MKKRHRYPRTRRIVALAGPLEARQRVRRRFASISSRSVLLFCLPAALSLSAATYYVDCQNGGDSNDGLSPSTAWRTIDRANQPNYGPGDVILLKRGCVWPGPGFKAKGNGSVPTPSFVLQ